MLVQATTPRPIFNAVESPEHVRIQTLRKPDVSEGIVRFSYVGDLVAGTPTTVVLEPHLVYPLEGQKGFEVLEYYLPFEKAFAVSPKVAKQMVKYEASGVASIALAPLMANGFTVVVFSAFRADRTVYEQRTISFKLLFPITGGGVLQVSDSFVDIANPTFNPRAPIPKPSLSRDVQVGFNRVHHVVPAAEQAKIEARRRARIEEAEANIRANSTKSLSGKAVPALPPSSRKDREG